MTYKETLFFVGKCLTISHEEHNKVLVEKELKSGKVDWDNVVKLSTAHYVFPALYCNLKRADFLHFLPIDLVEYMKHITDLNRERNQQIIDQAKEINELLLSNNITPIFLKGTGNLLEGLYEDIGERMVGDIDFLVNPRLGKKTLQVLKHFGYKFDKTTLIDSQYISRHYNILINNKKTTSVEVHHSLTESPYRKIFNYHNLKSCFEKNNSITTLNQEKKFLHTLLNKQINDLGNKSKNFALRNSYDIFLLSLKTDLESVFNEFKGKTNPLKNYIAITNIVFGGVNSLSYLNEDSYKKEIEEYISLIENPEKAKKKGLKTIRKKTLRKRLKILFLSLGRPDYRSHVLSKVFDLNFYKKVLFGTKPNS